MSDLVLAVGFLVVALHEFWRKGEADAVSVGEIIEVTRAERNSLVSSHVARDATDAEIAEFRGTPLPDEVLPDAGEAIAALETAQAELKAVETERDTLQGQVQSLTAEKDDLSKAVSEFSDEIDNLKAANAVQAKALEAKKAAAK
ncbi:hypothetical protein B1F68_10510 [Pseudomonas syringae]|uniref:hypothetical protein n=1 Tax=Pseudomonas syringae TaxID=317 RepID=UPI001010DBFB|nr:hypothetical protein [Pseudomonas syringae]RXU06994.1 hypothetical protein B1F68_10295 [Pseudomonas syringae]RXU07033.1 hypothetical protein B1F68_10510 [Pseudomonas syringae]